MAERVVPIMPMPEPTRSYAPRFNGRGKDVKAFIEDFLYHADRAELTAAERVSQIVRYTNLDTRELWESLPAFATGNWGQLNAQILEKYPDVGDDARKYDIESLENYVDDQKYEKVRNLTDWGKYDRGFTKIALWLSNRNHLCGRRTK